MVTHVSSRRAEPQLSVCGLFWRPGSASWVELTTELSVNEEQTHNVYSEFRHSRSDGRD